MAGTVFGGQEMQRRIAALAKEMQDRIASALRMEAEVIMTRSKRDHVPVHLGALRGSGHVQPVRRVAGGYEVTLVYGGAAAPYALPVHEHPSSSSPPSWRGVDVEFHPSGRGPKYLERPMKDAVAGMADRIAARIKL